MDAIVLKQKSAQGKSLEATFLPDRGMNLCSYKCQSTEVIDPTTRAQFEDHFAGLGPLIGPHFHRRRPEVIPPIQDESLFPHIARVKSQGVTEPFSHGIARYAPWTAVQATETKISAKLTGKDLWNGVPLSALEGQNFTYAFQAELTPSGLALDLSVASDADSLVGIHYYYHLPQGTGHVISQIQKTYIDVGQRKPIPDTWSIDSQHRLTFDLSQAADFTFFPFPNPLQGTILLDAVTYRLKTTYTCLSQENAWQLYHPTGASFVCIEPISAQDPRHANLTASRIQIQLEIMDAG